MGSQPARPGSLSALGWCSSPPSLLQPRPQTRCGIRPLKPASSPGCELPTSQLAHPDWCLPERPRLQKADWGQSQRDPDEPPGLPPRVVTTITKIIIIPTITTATTCLMPGAVLFTTTPRGRCDDSPISQRETLRLGEVDSLPPGYGT